MELLERILQKIADGLEHLEERSKPLFVVAALGLYVYSLVEAAGTYPITAETEAFLIQALANLSIPFGVLLMQELLELIANISHSTLQSARRQFEIVVLVLVRGFFKSFDSLNEHVAGEVYGGYVMDSVIKVVAIVIITGLITQFVKMSRKGTLIPYILESRTANLYKQTFVVTLTGFILTMQLLNGFNGDDFIVTIFTALIVADAIFLVFAIVRNSNFDKLAFESALVIALIFVRYPLLPGSNTISFGFSIVGILFATVSLHFFIHSRSMEEAYAKLANTSHEIRTSVNSIIGYSEMLSEDDKDVDPEEFKSDLAKIREAGQKLIPLVENVLDIARKKDEDL